MICSASTAIPSTSRARSAASRVLLAMMPATSGTLPFTSSAQAAIRRLNSSRVRVWPSPVLPPTQTPCTPLPRKKRTWARKAFSSISPSASKGVVMGGMMPVSLACTLSSSL